MTEPTGSPDERPRPPDGPLYNWASPAGTGAAGSEAGSRTAARLRPVVWIVGILGLLFLAFVIEKAQRLGAGRSMELDPVGFGRVVGATIGAMLAGFAFRWVWVRTRGGGRRVRSPWVVAIAAVWMLIVYLVTP